VRQRLQDGEETKMGKKQDVEVSPRVGLLGELEVEMVRG
jgi:hypothetical protein